MFWLRNKEIKFSLHTLTKVVVLENFEKSLNFIAESLLCCLILGEKSYMYFRAFMKLKF